MARLERVTKRYGTVTALDDVTLEIRPGEIHALIGDNGAGKSTVVSLLAGWTRPDSGMITYARRTSVVAQQTTLVAGLTPSENLSLPRLGSMLAPISPLGTLAGDFVEDLPAAERQRLEWRKALDLDPDLLIFDEPFSDIPSFARDAMRDEIRRLRSSSRGILLVTHDPVDVFALADRVTRLDHGRVVVQGYGPLPISPTPHERRSPTALVVHPLREFVPSRGSNAVTVLSPATRFGLLLQETLATNLLLDSEIRRRCTKFGFVSWGSLTTLARKILDEWEVVASGPDALAGSLSGGNAQKFALGRALAIPNRDVIAVQPLRGLDERAAKLASHRLASAAASGVRITIYTDDVRERAQLEAT